MIPCYELRIGNYVLAEQKLQRISMLNDKTSSANTFSTDANNNTDNGPEHKLASIQPVALTDDILKQCNFVYHSYFKFWQLINPPENNRSEMNVDRDYNILDFMRKPIVSRVKSLHQLQNIYFMLKGKELLFKETA